MLQGVARPAYAPTWREICWMKVALPVRRRSTYRPFPLTGHGSHWHGSHGSHDSHGGHGSHCDRLARTRRPQAPTMRARRTSYPIAADPGDTAMPGSLRGRDLTRRAQTDCRRARCRGGAAAAALLGRRAGRCGHGAARNGACAGPLAAPSRARVAAAVRPCSAPRPPPPAAAGGHFLSNLTGARVDDVIQRLEGLFGVTPANRF